MKLKNPSFSKLTPKGNEVYFLEALDVESNFNSCTFERRCLKDLQKLERESFEKRVMGIEREREKIREEEDQNF